MNRSPLNQSLLGTGASNNLVRITITQLLSMVGSVRGTVLKYATITQNHVLDHTLRATVWVTEVIETVCEHISFLASRIESGVSTPLSDTLELIGACRGTKESFNYLETACTQESSLNYTVALQVYFHGTLLHGLEGSTMGYDLNTSKASVERQIVCPAEQRSLSVFA